MKTSTAILPRPVEAPAGHTLPVAAICLIVLVLWYIAAIPMNWVVTEARIEEAGGGLYNILAISWNHNRPVIPAPHQIAVELWNSIFMVAPWKVKSLIFHAWVTVSSMLLGFLLGTVFGIGLAIAITRSRLLSKCLMPWIIASQTVPILAIAPMIIVVLGSIGLTGLVPKSLISMYLCFFPVTIGMVKGLASPETMQLDLMRTYNASHSQTLWKLRFPASVPFLFASMKVGVAVALTGAIVGELPTGAISGLGARLLNGSYYGQTVQIWAALFVASFVAAGLVRFVGYCERRAALGMGAKT